MKGSDLINNNDQKMNYKHFNKVLMIVIVTGLVSCNVTRKYQRISIDMPEDYRTVDSIKRTVPTEADSGIAVIPYRDFFKDPVLIELIDKAVARNYDMQIAVKQIEYAGQSLKQAKWGNIPTVSATIGSGTLSRPSENSLNGSMIPQFLGQTYTTDYTTSLNIGWEADIWGKIKNRKDAALAAYLQTEEARKAVQTGLVVSVAQGYYNLLMLDQQLEITRESIALFDKTIAATQLLRDAGDVTTLGLQQQEASREAALASLPVIEAGIAVQENALRILTGENPGSIERDVSLKDVVLREELPVSYPAFLLSNRPDVRQAELNVMQSVAQENVAHTGLYPSLSLSAQGGFNAVDFSNWFNIPGSLFGSLAGSLTSPILNGRQLKTQYNQAKIGAEQAELRFKQAVQTALGEVSDALIQIEKLKPQEEHTQKQVETLTGAVKNADLLYASGMSTYLEVLSAQNSKLQAELNLASIETQRLNAVVILYRALGGGWK